MATKRTTTTNNTEPTPITYDLVITELRVLPTSDRLLGLYELGIDGCANEDLGQTRAVLVELLGALDTAYADIAEGFERLYRYCIDQIATGHFDRVGYIMRDLRDTLQEAVNEVNATPNDLTQRLRAASA